MREHAILFYKWCCLHNEIKCDFMEERSYSVEELYVIFLTEIKISVSASELSDSVCYKSSSLR